MEVIHQCSKTLPFPIIKTSLQSRSAFTLIEIIIYVALSSIILVALMRVLIVVTASREKTVVRSVVQQEMRYAMHRMEGALRNAIDVTTGSSTFDSANGVLSLTMSGASITPTVFRLQNGHITVQEGAGTVLPITSSGVVVTELRFTNLSVTGGQQTVRLRVTGTDARANDEDLTYVDTFTAQSSITLRQ